MITKYEEVTYFVIVYVDASTGEAERGSIAYKHEGYARRVADVLNNLSEDGATFELAGLRLDAQSLRLHHARTVHYVEPVICNLPMIGAPRTPSYARITYQTDPPTLSYLR